MAADGSTRLEHASRVPEGLVLLGAVFPLAQVATAFLLGGPAGVGTWDVQLSVGLTTVFAIPVVVGGAWLSRSEIARARYGRVAAWCLGVSLAILAVNAVMILTWPADTVGQNVSWAVQAAAMGAAGGVLFGNIEARAIERARAAERARVRADHLEAQQEWLEYLNSLLRHEVLNTANVIVGYSELLLENHDVDDRTRTRIERIARQSEELTDVIQDVRLLLDASTDAVELEPVDVAHVLQAETAALEERHEGVSVETSAPEAATVRADDLLGRAFANLLDNAVEHNDADQPRIDVDVEATAEAVTIAIADNGPGVPPDERETLFERSTDGEHGLGLYLVRTLVERYGGTVELAETGPGGSVFTVELPRAGTGSSSPDGATLGTPGSAGQPADGGPGDRADPLLRGR